MQIYPIVSSSNGNCILIESGKSSILIDMGMSVRALIQSTSKEKINNLDAVLITHEHADHIRGLKTFGKRFYQVPVYINELSYSAREKKMDTINRKNVYAGMNFTIGDFDIRAFTAKHDTHCCLGYIIDDGVNRLGYLTDTGSITKLIEKELRDINILFIEADYDTEKLANYEPYDEFLRNRISCNFGHLSNDQAMGLIETIGIDNLKQVFIGHLSKNTNTPEIVLNIAKDRFPNDIDKFILAPLEEGILIN